MKEISSNAVHNFTVRLRAVSEFIDSMSVSDVRKVMSTHMVLNLGTNQTVTKRVYSYNNDKDEIIKTGIFYPIRDVYDKLNPIHQFGINMYSEIMNIPSLS